MPLDITTPGQIGLWIHRAETALGHLHEISKLGFTYTLPKMWEDGQFYGDPAAFRQLASDAAGANLAVVPWGYCRPVEIEAQIQVVADNLPANAAGIVIDAEIEWEKAGVELVAHQLAHGIAQATGHRAPLHLSSFYAPNLHPQFPYAAFLMHCQSFMPQSYIEGGTPADLVVSRTMTQAYTLAKQAGRVLIPTVNTPALLPLLRSAGVRTANVWLWDGDNQDTGVLGRESLWTPAITGFKG